MSTDQESYQEPSQAEPPQQETAAPTGRSSRSKWIILAASAIAVALFAAPMLLERRPAENAGDAAAVSPARAGASCPANQGAANLNFTLKDSRGASVRLADYKGKVILLNFWATWCGPCKIEIPEFVELYDQYKDRGFVILGMLTEDTPSAEELRAFTTQYKMNYPILYSQEGLEDAFGPIYGIPTSFFIGRDGTICQKHMGPATREEFERTIKSLL
jgi:peroxiredoxin